MEFRILGDLEAENADRLVPLGPAERKVLAVLLLDAGRMVPADRLLSALWDSEPPATAAKAMRNVVSRLRRLLASAGMAGVVQTIGTGYRLAVSSECIDARVFESQVAQAEQVAAAGRRADAARLLRSALALWRGPALSGVEGLKIEAAAAPWNERRWAVTETCYDHELALGRHRQLIGELSALVAEHPLREKPVAQLMLALYRDGRRAEALTVYRAIRCRLADELGLEPSAELQQLHQEILTDGSALADAGGRGERETSAGVAPTPARGGQPTSVTAVIPAELPRNIRDFVGRAGELAELDALLAAAERASPAATVACVDGMAGVGKSALVVQWAHRVRGRFPAGTLFLDLRGHDPYQAPMSSTEGLTELLRSLGTSSQGLPIDAATLARLYRTALADGRRLLVLDNAASAEQVRPLLPGTPACMTLVTSRSRLTGLVATSEAHRIGLAPLPGQDAVNLLRAIIGAEQLRAQPESVAELAALCGHLPLALRIAGANSAAYPDRLLNTMLDELGASRMTGLQVDGDHELAVRRAFDLTCDNLPAPALRLFILLARSPLTSFNVEAAGALSAVGNGTAARLIDMLAIAHVIEEHTGGRYRIHDLLRHYAANCDDGTTADLSAAFTRLVDWQLEVVMEASATTGIPRLLIPPVKPGSRRLRSPLGLADHEAADRWLECERPNLVSSVCYSARHDPKPSAWRLALELRGFLRLRRYSSDWVATAAAASSISEQLGDAQAQAACAHSLGHAHWSLGDYDTALGHFERALGRSRDSEWAEGITGSLSALGAVHHELGRHEEAIDYYRQALADYGGPTRELRIITEGSLGLVYQSVGRLREAVTCFQAALDLVASEADKRPDAVATGLGNLGMACADLGELAQAQQHMNRALNLYRQAGSLNGEANVLTGLAGVDAERGRHDEATYQSTLALRIAKDIGDRRIECDALVALARSRRLRGESPAARERVTEAIAIAEQIGYGRGVPDALCLLAAIDLDLGDLPGATASCDRAMALARAAGHRPTEARALHVAAQLRLAAGRYDAALRNARSALAISRELGLKLVEARALCTLSQILTATDSQAADAAARQAADLLKATGAVAVAEQQGEDLASGSGATLRSG